MEIGSIPGVKSSSAGTEAPSLTRVRKHSVRLWCSTSESALAPPLWRREAANQALFEQDTGPIRRPQSSNSLAQQAGDLSSAAQPTWPSGARLVVAGRLADVCEVIEHLVAQHEQTSRRKSVERFPQQGSGSLP